MRYKVFGRSLGRCRISRRCWRRCLLFGFSFLFVVLVSFVAFLGELRGSFDLFIWLGFVGFSRKFFYGLYIVFIGGE